jgi:hypothetical protein
MFVPSLSWKTIVLYLFNVAQKTAFSYLCRIRHRTKQRVEIRVRLRKAPLVFEFSLCLSQAGLGKMSHFVYKWHRKNGVFRTRVFASAPPSAHSCPPVEIQPFVSIPLTFFPEPVLANDDRPFKIRNMAQRKFSFFVPLASKRCAFAVENAMKISPLPAKNATLFLSFPYVCPEPVLVK